MDHSFGIHITKQGRTVEIHRFSTNRVNFIELLSNRLLCWTRLLICKFKFSLLWFILQKSLHPFLFLPSLNNTISSAFLSDDFFDGSDLSRLFLRF